MPANTDQLLPDESLGSDQFLVSTDGRYTFVYQGDGNLVLYKNYRTGGRRALWASGTAGTPAGTCIMQGDGNLVIYDPAGQYVWDSATGDPGSRVVVQGDGNVVIYRPDGSASWATDTVQQAVPSGPAAQGDDIQPGEVLTPDQSISSSDARYTFVFQGDGNLVLYKNFRGSDRRALWATNTAGRPGEVCIMQGDGNLVIYDQDGQYVWDSGTGDPDSRLVVQGDGNVVIYRPDGSAAWATNTAQPAPGGPIAQGNDMQPGEILDPNTSLTSTNGLYQFVYQSDGNLVLYRTSDGSPLWNSQTGGRPGEVCIMQGDGNLVIYDQNGQYVWDSGTGDPGSRLVVQDDGNVVIYRPDNTPVWVFADVRLLRSDVADIDGWIEVTLLRNGTVRFRGHAHNGGIQSFSFRVTVIVGGENTRVAMVYEGHVGGWQIGSNDPKDEDWDQTSVHPLVGATFSQYQNSSLEIKVDKRGDITGWLEDAGTFLVRFVVGTVLLNNPATLGIIVLVGAGASLALTGGFDAGARIIGSTIWLAGPQGTLVALAAEGVAALGSRTREITQNEYNWANDEVFGGTLPPRERIIITDTIGANNAEFVFPRYDGKITVNLGAGLYDNPQTDEPSTFIHELVHAWQLHNVYSDLAYLGVAIPLQLFNREGAYDISSVDGTQPFNSLNIEQQAMVVEKWFRDGAIEDFSHDYYPYIVENIRTGTA